MLEPTSQVIAALREKFPDVDFAPAPLVERAKGSTGTEQICVRIAQTRLREIMQFLRDDDRCDYQQLCDLAGIDYLEFPDARDRFGVLYSLLSLRRNHRLWVKCFVNDPEPTLPSVTGVWKGAEWMEREVWDMFGIRFTDHPDLRRILTWEGFKAHPLRKDYPLRGQGERVNFEVLTRDSR